MIQNLRRMLSLKKLLRDERGAVLIIFTVYLPVVVGFFTMAVDMSYIYRTRNALQATAEAAALAATAELPDPVTSCSQAKLYATRNMDPATYGNVLKQDTTDCSDVVLGRWALNCAAGTNCFDPLPSGQTCLAFQCNAAQVTTRMAAVNSNALALVFAPMIGISSFNVTATAIAVFGSNGVPWDMSIVQDISGSFTDELPQAKAANMALLNCMNANAPAGSRLGITAFTGTSLEYQSPSAVNTNFAALEDKINNLPACSSGPGVPQCSSGTNIGGGIKTTLQANANSPNPIAGTQKNIVIVTDGLPNSASGCTGGNCTPKGYAEDQVNAAYDQGNGANIYTIYLCTTGTCSSSVETWMASLVRGSGKALVTPTSAQLTTLMGQVCASQPHRLVW